MDMSDIDRELLEQVRASLSADSDSDDDLIDMIMTGYDLTMSGTRVAEAIEQSALAATRSDDGSPRFWTCVVDEVRFEFELADSGVIGSIEPPIRGRMILHQPEGLTSVEVTPAGGFALDRPSDAPFRLYFQPQDGDPIATAWILP